MGLGLEMLATDWRLWFIHLSGWPVFLAITITAIVFSLGLSMLMPALGNRSVLKNAALVVVALALGTVVFLGTLVLASRVAFGE